VCRLREHCAHLIPVTFRGRERLPVWQLVKLEELRGPGQFNRRLLYQGAYHQWSFQTLILRPDPPHSRRRNRRDLSRVIVRVMVNPDALNGPPISSACFPVMARPVKMRSFAFDTPSKRTRRCVPPAPGMIPNFVSGKPIFVAPDPVCACQL